MVGIVAALTGCGANAGFRPDANESADLRTVLMDPADPVWRTPAPERFTASFQTSAGDFVVDVQREWAPRGADRFFHLARTGYYDDSRFFRVVPDFIAQFGIPGDPQVTRAWEGQTLLDDPVGASNVRGSLAYAMTGPDTRHTQIYINLVDNIRLDSTGFAPFGQVIEGIDVLDAIYSGYGEESGGGMRRGEQGRMLTEGNQHLDADFPLLTHLIRVEVTPVPR